MSTNGGNRYQWDTHKGSWNRPMDVSKATRDENWDRIFGKKQDKDIEQIEDKVVEVCEACDNTGGQFDCGLYYECPECKK